MLSKSIDFIFDKKWKLTSLYFSNFKQNKAYMFLFDWNGNVYYLINKLYFFRKSLKVNSINEWA